MRQQCYPLFCFSVSWMILASLLPSLLHLFPLLPPSHPSSSSSWKISAFWLALQSPLLLQPLPHHHCCYQWTPFSSSLMILVFLLALSLSSLFPHHPSFPSSSSSPTSLVSERPPPPQSPPWPPPPFVPQHPSIPSSSSSPTSLVSEQPPPPQPPPWPPPPFVSSTPWQDRCSPLRPSFSFSYPYHPLSSHPSQFVSPLLSPVS
mmetsp:Transcript_31988/g.67699  ORF Transcript_31988/g.67699 Transcript_31988/m.67699 type:complete len:204 (-) Transcript_31988:936-1547(-)